MVPDIDSWRIVIYRHIDLLSHPYREQDIVRPPDPIQITPELLNATAFYSGI